MSYLETSHSKELYLTQKLSKKAENTRINAKISLDWFDKFCLGKYENRSQEQIIIDLVSLNEDGKQQKFKSALFSMLQAYIDYLEINNHAPDTIRNHINRVKDYLNYRYIPVYKVDAKYEEIKLQEKQDAEEARKLWEYERERKQMERRIQQNYKPKKKVKPTVTYSRPPIDNSVKNSSTSTSDGIFGFMIIVIMTYFGVGTISFLLFAVVRSDISNVFNYFWIYSLDASILGVIAASIVGVILYFRKKTHP